MFEQVESGDDRVWQVTPSAGLSRAETDQFTLLQLSLEPFHLVVNLWCKLDLKGRVTANNMKCEPEQKQGETGAAELLHWEFHATASLISRHCLPQL